MRGTMAGDAGWSLAVAVLAGDGMDPQLIAVNGLLVASGALLGCGGRSVAYLVFVAVTAGAGGLPQQAMHALRNLMAGIVVTTGATDLGHGHWVRIIFHTLMASSAAQVAVHAGGMFLGIDVQTLACARLHPLVAMTRQAILVGGRGCRQH